MIYITVELNKPVYIKIPKNITGTPDYKLMMDSQAGGQQFVFQNLNDLGGQSIFKFVLVFETYTPGGTYNYKLLDSLDKVVSKGLIQVNTVGVEDYFYDENELGYFVEEEESGDMSNYYTKSQVDSMLTQYEKKSDLPDFNNFVTEEELGEYVTSEELQQEVESYINSKDLINSTQLANTLEWYVTLNELQGMGYVTASELPTVNDATVTVKQGGNVMGSFTLNQSNNVEILLNEGGQGGGISMNDVKQYVDSQGYVMSSSLDSMSYVTSDYLDNAGYITTQNVRDNYYNKPETEANFTSYAYIEERISRIPGGGISMDDVKNYVVSQSYVTSNELSNTGYITSEYLSNQAYITPSVLNAQAYITLNDVPVVDLSSYVTYTYLEERLSEYQPSVDLSAYVTKTELENCSYVTKNALEGNYYSKTDINNMGYITINDVPGVDLSAYVKYSDLNNYGYITKQELNNQSYITPSVLNAQAYITATQLNACGYATVSQIPTVSNAGIVLRQGGVTKGTFNLNQSTGATIDLDEGGQVDLSSYVTKSELVEQSYITLNDVPVVDLSSYVTYTYLEETLAEYQPAIDLSSYVTKTDLVNQSYITNTYLDDYVTYTYLEERLSDIGIDLSSYVSKQELKDQSYVTKQFLTNRSYVTSQQLVDQSYITMADVSAQSYVTKQDMVNQSYVTSQYLDNQSYVTQVQLASNSYVTSAYMDSFFNNHTTALLFTMGNDTIKVITFYTQDEL